MLLQATNRLMGLFWTGGVPTGKAVMAKASENLTPVTLELGGKGANIVFPDANIRYASLKAVQWNFHECRPDVLGVVKINCSRRCT